MHKLNEQEAAAYAGQGFFVRKGVLGADEVRLFRDRSRAYFEAERNAGAMKDRIDPEGRAVSIKMWPTAGEDQYGLLARDERVLELAQSAVEKPIYLIWQEVWMKPAKKGGEWGWHQDFGTWYNYGHLSPEMSTVYVALDESVQENGGLQVLKGSHTLGRLNHVRQNDKTDRERTIVDPARLEAAMRRFELLALELQAGDVLVFHPNLLHYSGPNRSSSDLWAYLSYYCAVDNAPHPNQQPLTKAAAGSFRTASGMSATTPATAGAWMPAPATSFD